ncbi:MAG: zinc ABC transporter substrate-binding protein [Oscillospiraceae bacterium]|nr:zinc ABC transporter substrate-binding protein [Oscillospiraceae bacterium]
MKRMLLFILAATLLVTLFGCAPKEYAQVAATTLPVFEFTSRLCEGTGITVSRLVTESVSCLHDYSLNVDQVRAAEAAEIVVINGAGLEEFMEDILADKATIDASENIGILECEESHDHDHEDESHEGHHHEVDSHIWLSPFNASVMAVNICNGLMAQYPEYADIFTANLKTLSSELEELRIYGETQLEILSCRDLITFHDGFGYLAACYNLHILEAVEEESGSEASAAELKHLITEVRHHNLPAIFTESNGSTSAASVIARETGASVYTLDMAMAGDSWFDAMYRNIDTLKEALG